MTRVTNAVASHRRKKRIFRQAKGYVGDRKNHLRLTTEAIMRALAFNYCHRKHNKRNFRRLWITRIGVAAKIHGISYSKFIQGLKIANCDVDRKMLSELAINDPEGFAYIANIAKSALTTV